MGKLTLIDVSEATREAGVTRQTVYRWIEDGFDIGPDFHRAYLTAVRLSGAYYIDPDDLDDFLAIRDDFYGNDDAADNDDDEDE